MWFRRLSVRTCRNPSSWEAVIGRPNAPSADLVDVVIPDCARHPRGSTGFPSAAWRSSRLPSCTWRASGHSANTAHERNGPQPIRMRCGAWRCFHRPLWLIYDGRHWPLDVIGGYAYGAFYLLALIAAYNWVLKRRSGESTHDRRSGESRHPGPGRE